MGMTYAADYDVLLVRAQCGLSETPGLGSEQRHCLAVLHRSTGPQPGPGTQPGRGPQPGPGPASDQHRTDRSVILFLKVTWLFR